MPSITGLLLISYSRLGPQPVAGIGQFRVDRQAAGLCPVGRVHAVGVLGIPTAETSAHGLAGGHRRRRRGGAETEADAPGLELLTIPMTAHWLRMTKTHCTYPPVELANWSPSSITLGSMIVTGTRHHAHGEPCCCRSRLMKLVDAGGVPGSRHFAAAGPGRAADLGQARRSGPGRPGRC